MQCDICNKGVESGPLYRVNELGEKGIFRHESCGGQAPDLETKKLVDLIDSSREKKQ